MGGQRNSVGPLPACPPPRSRRWLDGKRKRKSSQCLVKSSMSGTGPAVPPHPAGHPRVTSCSRRVLQPSPVLGATPGALSPSRDPWDTPCVTWAPQILWTPLVPHGHPRISVSVHPSVPRTPQFSAGFPGVPQTPRVPCGHPRNSMSPGSHGHPCLRWRARGPHVTQTPQIPAGSPGVQFPSSPSAPRGSGRCYRDGSALGWAIRGAPRALPPALPHSPAGSGRRRRDLPGGP